MLNWLRERPETAQRDADAKPLAKSSEERESCAEFGPLEELVGILGDFSFRRSSCAFRCSWTLRTAHASALLG